MDELASGLALCDIAHEVEVLTGIDEGSLEQVVVVRCRDELVAHRPLLAEECRDLRQQGAYPSGPIIHVKKAVQLLVEGAGPCHYRDVLGHSEEINDLAGREVVSVRQISCQFDP
jgi:hypothetical protein